MAIRNEAVIELFRKAEARFGFRFVCELHQALVSNAPEAQQLLRKALAA